MSTDTKTYPLIQDFVPSGARNNWIATLSDKRWWTFYFAIIVAICVSGIGYFGGVAHYQNPPNCDFVDQNGKVVFPQSMIKHGEEIFHLRGLMSYGSFLGDGSEHGVDYTAEALHMMALSMGDFYAEQLKQNTSRELAEHDMEAVKARVRLELRANTYNEKRDVVVLNEAMVYAWKDLEKYHLRMHFEDGFGDLLPNERFAKKRDVSDMAAFFYWGGWISVAARPGEVYSYTHNWPHDPLVGNLPTAATILWSTLSVGVLFLGLGITLFIWGQRKDEIEADDGTTGKPLTTQDLELGVVHPTQLACYKFFVLSMIAFAIQVLGGIACSVDVVRPGGLTLCMWIPYTVLRSYHTTFQIYWFFVAWVGTTIFFLPRFQKKPPAGQLFLINLLGVGCAIVAAGGVIGIPLGQGGYLEGDMAYYFGSQGWEFMELGRAFQDILLGGFVLWIFILFRGVYSYITWDTIWSTPAWLFYGSLVMVWFLFFSLKVTPDTDFVVSDFWRWMVVHMWVEVTFEVFTTVIVAYLYREMGLVSKKGAERATYIAVMLFFLTATIGVGHNFYWIAKPTGVIALGSAFSTTQVMPLILLTLDAWKYIQVSERAELERKKGNQKHVMKAAWLFLLGVNFWNVFGAGILGSFINMPIVNYYMHATYLTGNHAHGAMFGVKGNVALAGVLFCAQHLVKEEAWSPKLLSLSFWCMNGGIAAQMFLSLFPTGMYHMYINMMEGLYAARKFEVTQGYIFQTLAKGRAVGGHIFLWGGLLPLVYFIVSRAAYLKDANKHAPGKRYQSFWLDSAHTAGYKVKVY